MTPMHDLLAPYLLGSLDDQEYEAFTAHLLGCAECQAEMSELEFGLANLANANAVASPPAVRDSVLESLEDVSPARAPVEKQRPRWNSLVLSAAAVLIVAFGLFAIFGSNPIDAIVGAPDATVVALAPSDALPGQPPATAQVVFSPSKDGAVVEIDDLAPPTGSNVYEIWLIDGEGATPAGTFIPNEDGTVQVLLEETPEPGFVVGITEEPEGGSTTPTGDVLFISGEF